MADYIQDPNDSKKQVPGAPPDNYYDKSAVPAVCTFIKSPNYVIVNKTHAVSFFFGSSASFSALGVGDAATSSSHYSSFGTVTAGTRFDINPTAWSGSTADQSVAFIYKGGLDGSGR